MKALRDISTIQINDTLPKGERVRDLVNGLENPFNFVCHGREVVLNFADPDSDLTTLDCILGIFL